MKHYYDVSNFPLCQDPSGQEIQVALATRIFSLRQAPPAKRTDVLGIKISNLNKSPGAQFLSFLVS